MPLYRMDYRLDDQETWSVLFEAAGFDEAYGRGLAEIERHHHERKYETDKPKPIQLPAHFQRTLKAN